MASVTYDKCYLWQRYYGKCNYGKDIMANETEPTKVLNKTLIFLQYKTACKQIVQHWFCKSTFVNWALPSLQGRIQDLSEGGARFFRNKRIHN